MNQSKASFVDKWKKQHERKVFDFSIESDQEEFNEAVSELVKYIVHTSKKASIATVTDASGIRTVYLSVVDY